MTVPPGLGTPVAAPENVQAEERGHKRERHTDKYDWGRKGRPMLSVVLELPRITVASHRSLKLNLVKVFDSAVTPTSVTLIDIEEDRR